MVDEHDHHIIGVTESCANSDITGGELGLNRCLENTEREEEQRECYYISRELPARGQTFLFNNTGRIGRKHGNVLCSDRYYPTYRPPHPRQ